MHNGQVGGWQTVRRRVEMMIPDAVYPSRTGTGDSEALFLAALGRGLEHDPAAAFRAVVDDVRTEMRRAGIAEPLRFTATLTDGDTLWAFRWSCDARPPSLYYKQDAAGLRLVSEPIDGQKDGWVEVPRGGTLVAGRGEAVRIGVPGLAAAA